MTRHSHCYINDRKNTPLKRRHLGAGGRVTVYIFDKTIEKVSILDYNGHMELKEDFMGEVARDFPQLSMIADSIQYEILSDENGVIRY